jgi:hypothetical protein
MSYNPKKLVFFLYDFLQEAAIRSRQTGTRLWNEQKKTTLEIQIGGDLFSIF